MRRAFSLYGHAASVEARKAMSYRADFWINVVLTFFAQLGVMWFLWKAIFAASGQITLGGWDLPGILRYTILVILAGKLVRGPEMASGLSQDIYDGGLSRYLLYPVSYWAFKYAQHVGSLVPSAAQFLLFFLLAPLLPGSVGAFHLQLPHLLMGVLALVLANLLYWLLQLPLQAVAFWADNVWSLSVLLRFISGLLGGAMLPLDLFPEKARAVLELLPFATLFDLPVNALLGRMEAGQWAKGMALGMGWCLLLFLASRRLWRAGERGYTGVGI